MKRFFVFLFVLIFFSPKVGSNDVLCESIKKIETNKKEFVNSKKAIEHFEKSNSEDCDFVVDTSTWHRASASHYNALDSSQTKENPDGVGAFGRRIRSGSIALGSSITKTLIKKNLVAFIEVEGLEDVETPYGKGIFRVDDSMGDKFSKNDKFYVDFNQHDLNQELKRRGRFKIRFRFISFHPARSLS